VGCDLLERRTHLFLGRPDGVALDLLELLLELFLGQVAVLRLPLQVVDDHLVEVVDRALDPTDDGVLCTLVLPVAEARVGPLPERVGQEQEYSGRDKAQALDQIRNKLFHWGCLSGQRNAAR